MRLLLPVIAVGVLILCITLFFEGLTRKDKGREAEQAMETTFRKYERKGDGNAGRLGDWTKRLLAWVRRRGHASVAAGRRFRAKLTR